MPTTIWVKTLGAAGKINLFPSCLIYSIRPASFAMWTLTAVGVNPFYNATSTTSSNPHPSGSKSLAVWTGHQWLEKGDNFPEWAAGRLRVQKERGAEGLKIWKSLRSACQGSHWESWSMWMTCASIPSGKRRANSVCRFSSMWLTRLPFLIRSMRPMNAGRNSINHPDWAFTSPPFPPFLHIVEGLASIVTRHPQTTFIGAHVGCYAENLGWVGALLDRCPNFNVDISARIGELGRQPYTARHFFMRYSDRILFGSDMGPYPEAYRVIYRFLETDDEYFNYNAAPIPMQGRWHVHGLFLA